MNWEIRQGAALDLLREMPDGCVQTCVTSPPYFGLRAYGTDPQIFGGDPVCEHIWRENPGDPKGWGGASGKIKRPESINLANAETANGSNSGGAYNRGSPRGSTCTLCGAWRGELGSEPDVRMFVDHLVEVFREVKRVLRPDGTAWVNLGDSMAAGKSGRSDMGVERNPNGFHGTPNVHSELPPVQRKAPPGIPAKNLLLTPWRLALALQDDGWIVRSVICWAKKAPMPESVTDRPTSAWEPIFLLSKQTRYFYDAEAVREDAASADRPQPTADMKTKDPNHTEWLDNRYAPGPSGYGVNPAGRNQRNVWEIPGDDLSDFWKLSPEPYKQAHFATFPTEIPRRCILAGTSAAGQCAEPRCGKPWVRTTTRAIDNTGYANGPGGTKARDPRGNGASEHSTLATVARYATTTIAWSPTCQCPTTEPPVPQLVLDPFVGSGTTVLVANRLGRRGLGLELNPEYAQMARDRIHNDAPLLHEIAAVPPVGQGQGRLW